MVVDVQYLRNWNANDHNSLLNTVKELLIIYKCYQSSLLKGSRLEYDYNLLLEECSLNDVEVYVVGRNTVSSLRPYFPRDVSVYNSLESQSPNFP